MFFTKAEYKELYLPFIFDDNPQDSKDGVISIEAYGTILGEMKYCYASYFIIDSPDELRNLFKDTYLKTVKVTFKIKKGKVKDFKIDLQSLADAYNDNRLKKLEILGWGLNDKSFREINTNKL